MKMSTLLASLLLSAAILSPGLAAAADQEIPPAGPMAAGPAHGLPYPISLNHNYGPGREPGSFAYYDGPATNHCYQSAAGYIGQDNRRHPCF